MSEAVVIELGTAVAIAALARLERGRSFLLWLLGGGAAIMLGEIPLRLMILIADPSLVGGHVAMALTVSLIIGGILLAVLFGLPSRKADRPSSAPPPIARHRL